MKIIDGHAHIGWDTSNIKRNLLPINQLNSTLINKMSTYGIDKAIVMPFPSARAQFNANTFWYDLENKYVLDSKIHSDKLIPFLGVNPNDEECVDNVKMLAGLFKVNGIKLLHQNILKFSIESLINHKIMKIVEDNNLTFMIHIGTGQEKESHNYHMTLNYAVKVAEKYPDINFIFSHLGRLHECTQKALGMENVFMDTSGTSMMPWKTFVALDDDENLSSFSPTRVIENLVDLGFEKKLIWGSDEPYTHYKSELSIVNDAEIIQSKKRSILYENIARLLKL